MSRNCYVLICKPLLTADFIWGVYSTRELAETAIGEIELSNRKLKLGAFSGMKGEVIEKELIEE